MGKMILFGIKFVLTGMLRDCRGTKLAAAKHFVSNIIPFSWGGNMSVKSGGSLPVTCLYYVININGTGKGTSVSKYDIATYYKSTECVHRTCRGSGQFKLSFLAVYKLAVCQFAYEGHYKYHHITQHMKTVMV
jgi:hypothetical protein